MFELMERLLMLVICGKPIVWVKDSESKSIGDLTVMAKRQNIAPKEMR
jgi:hypothetical protein